MPLAPDSGLSFSLLPIVLLIEGKPDQEFADSQEAKHFPQWRVDKCSRVQTLFLHLQSGIHVLDGAVDVVWDGRIERGRARPARPKGLHGASRPRHVRRLQLRGRCRAAQHAHRHDVTILRHDPGQGCTESLRYKRVPNRLRDPRLLSLFTNECEIRPYCFALSNAKTIFLSCLYQGPFTPISNPKRRGEVRLFVL